MYKKKLISMFMVFFTLFPVSVFAHKATTEPKILNGVGLRDFKIIDGYINDIAIYEKPEPYVCSIKLHGHFSIGSKQESLCNFAFKARELNQRVYITFNDGFHIIHTIRFKSP